MRTNETTGLVRQAFTLIEILIVVVIIGILAAIVVPQMTGASDTAKASAVESDLATLQSQIQLFYVQSGAYPTFNANDWSEMINGGYLATAPSNPLNYQAGVFGSGTFTGGWVWDATGNQLNATNSANNGLYTP